MPEPETPPTPRKSAASIIAAGILASRLIGFVRERVIAHFFGVSAFTDVLQAAFKGPNLLQNLLGEGTLSAAFIPIYSRMLEEGREREAGRFAGAIFGLLLALVAVIVLMAIVLAEPIVMVLTPGWTQDAAKVAAGEMTIDRFELAVRAVRIMFPVTGTLVLSAWALGILNSHRRFFLPYFAPVLMNVAIIATLIGTSLFLFESPFDPEALGNVSLDLLTQLLFSAFFGALLGGLLQFLVQLPLVFRLLKGFRPSLSTKVTGVRKALKAFGPVVAGRGVVQISGYIDLFLASFLVAGALGVLRYATMLYLLPISLFGMSVAASELPELSRFGKDERAAFLNRFTQSIRQMLFLVIPTFVGYLAFGFLLIGALLRSGSFGVNDNWLVYLLLGAYTLGLLATATSRLMQNAFYALRDTKTPAKVAAFRVVIATAVAIPLMFALDTLQLAEVFHLNPKTDPLHLGVLGLGLGATVGAWIELIWLSTVLRRQIDRFALPWRGVFQMTGIALLAAGPAALTWWLLPDWHVALLTLIVVGLYGIGYLILAHLFGISEMEAWAGRFLRRFKR